MIFEGHSMSSANLIMLFDSNPTIEKLLNHFHLDFEGLSFSAAYHRLVELSLASMTVPHMLALVGAIFYAATFLMRTIVPLRVFGILSALFFIGYGLLGGAIATFLMYLFMLPINSLRLFQILKLVKKARTAARGDLSLEWLKPFMDRREYRKGEVLFRKGDTAHELFFTASGKFIATEIGVELRPGQLVGELGFLSPENKRTQTVECIESGTMMTLTYDRLLEIFYQNPDFGYYFLRLCTDRLLQNVARLEERVEQYKTKLQASAVTRS